MKTKQRLKKWTATALLAAMLSPVAMNQNVAHAKTGVALERIVPAANPAYMFTEDAMMNPPWSSFGNDELRDSGLFFSAFYDYTHEPLVELNKDRTKRTRLLVSSLNAIDLTFAYSVLKNIQVGASTQLAFVGFPNSSSKFGLADSRVFAKFKLNSDLESTSFALMPELWLPTGRNSIFLSDASLAAAIKFIAEHDFGGFKLAGNIGYRYSHNSEFRDLSMRSTIPVSLGALIPLSAKWALNADASADIVLPFNQYLNPSFYYLGAKYKLSDDILISAGGALGSINSYASADYRILAGVIVSPQGKREAPPPPPPPPVIPAVKKPARVTFSPKELLIAEEVKFLHNKAVLTAQGKNLLDEVAKVMIENIAQFKSIVIEGHTNPLGGFKYNQVLSENRAFAVKQYLVGKGIPADKLLTVGYGKTRPKKLDALNTSSLSKDDILALDRRVEFKVVQ